MRTAATARVRPRIVTGWPRAAAAAAALACVACEREEEGPPPSYTSRDSAGVEIVESLRCFWGGSVPWTVADTAQLRIGTVRGEAPYQFAGISDALRYPDGRIAVADEGSGQIRIFGADGRHIRSLGRLGDGPAEFRSIRRIMLAQDRLWAYDARRAQVSAFDETGALAETRPVQLGGPDATGIGDVRMLSNGELFGMDGSNLAPGPTPSVVRDTAYIFHLTRTAGAPVLAVPGSWTEHREIGGRGAVGVQALSPVPSWDAFGLNIYHSAGERFELMVSDTTGRVRRIARRLQSPPVITEADIERWKAPLLAQVPPDQRATAEEVLAGSVIPASLPVYTALQVDPSGIVWARRYGDEAPEWDVYDSGGACLGSVRTPVGLSVFEVGSDYVLGAWRDRSGVEYVQLHPLRK